MKTVVITGANVGIGYATARYIARQSDWHVVLACRNEQKGAAAAAAIVREQPRAQVTVAPLDLFSLSSVRALPGWLAAQKLPPIHGLILNAGGINMKAKAPEFTEDGFERTFQLNFLGHFLLANLMVESMSAPGRILFVSSDLHDPAATRMGRIHPPRYGPLEDLAYAKGSAARLRPMGRYATAKMYTIMCMYELSRRHVQAGQQIMVNAWSPGVVPTTQAGRGMPRVLKLIMTSGWFVSLMGSHLSTEEEAAEALGALLIDQRYEGITGRYFDGRREIPSSVESRDEDKGRSVWKQAEILAGLRQRAASEV